MILKPQDTLVLLKLTGIDNVARRTWTYGALALELSMSPAEVHAATIRAVAASLASRKAGKVVPVISNLEEFLIHGLKYVFVPERGELTRGMPTGVAAPPLREKFQPGKDPPPVWPDPEGSARGVAFSPIYKAAPKAARRDPFLYELLVLVDAIRGGRARERSVAIKELQHRLRERAHD